MENFRPTQPLGNRTVLLNIGERPFWAKHLREQEMEVYHQGHGTEPKPESGSASKLISFYLLLLSVSLVVR